MAVAVCGDGVGGVGEPWTEQTGAWWGGLRCLRLTLVEEDDDDEDADAAPLASPAAAFSLSHCWRRAARLEAAAEDAAASPAPPPPPSVIMGRRVCWGMKWGFRMRMRPSRRGPSVDGQHDMDMHTRTALWAWGCDVGVGKGEDG